MNKQRALLLPVQLLVIGSILIGLAYIYSTLRSDKVSVRQRDTTVEIGNSVNLYLNSHIHIKNSLVTFEIDSFDNKSVKYLYKNNDTLLSDTDHVYTISTISSDFSTYAIAQLGTIFDGCDVVQTQKTCSITVAQRLKSVESCTKALGVISVTECQDLYYLGERYITGEKKMCDKINDVTKNALCRE